MYDGCDIVTDANDATFESLEGFGGNKTPKSNLCPKVGGGEELRLSFNFEVPFVLAMGVVMAILLAVNTAVSTDIDGALNREASLSSGNVGAEKT